MIKILFVCHGNICRSPMAEFVMRDLVKAADKLSAYLKCLEELKAGNTEFRKAKEQTYAALLQNPLPALRCFMEEFLPGFELTLDELS